MLLGSVPGAGYWGVPAQCRGLGEHWDPRQNTTRAQRVVPARGSSGSSGFRAGKRMLPGWVLCQR